MKPFLAASLRLLALVAFTAACEPQVVEYACEPTTWWLDADEDGAGDAAFPTEGCAQPRDHVTNDLDCDDADPSVFGPITQWPDADGDGFGDANHPGEAFCELQEGWLLEAEDCDDTDRDANRPVYGHPDLDHDGFGEAGTDYQTFCHPEDRVRDNADDCDDTDPDVNPEAEEVCGDGVDQDCDGEDQTCG